MSKPLHRIAKGLGALLVVLPGLLGLQSMRDEPVMSISIAGGAPGPNTGGMTPLSARPVQRVEPKPELPKPEPVRPPAARTPDMVEPSKTTRTPPRTPVTTAPKEAASRTPTTGQQASKGPAACARPGKHEISGGRRRLAVADAADRP